MNKCREKEVKDVEKEKRKEKKDKESKNRTKLTSKPGPNAVL